MKMVQANARVPEAARPVLVAVAARLREDAGFLDRLAAFLADAAGGSPYEGRLAALEERVRALEVEKPHERTPPFVISPKYRPPPAPLDYRQSMELEPENPPAEMAADWSARAAAITVSTGEGRGRKLTAEGIALFEEMMLAGASHAEIASVFGMARQSVDTRAKKVRESSKD
ncbi:hypothetical protein [Xanthobacter sediminis]